MGRYVRKMQLMLTSMAKFSVETNIVDLDRTAQRAVKSGSTLFATKTGLE